MPRKKLTLRDAIRELRGVRFQMPPRNLVIAIVLIAALAVAFGLMFGTPR